MSGGLAWGWLAGWCRFFAKAPKPLDLVDRHFAPLTPDRLWAADFTYVSTWSGRCYTAFVIEAYARPILGWAVSTTMISQFVVDAVEQAIWTRHRDGRHRAGLIAHHGHGSRYLSVAYSEHLATAGIKPSTGAVGSSPDNALVESVIGLYKDRTRPQQESESRLKGLRTLRGIQATGDVRSWPHLSRNKNVATTPEVRVVAGAGARPMLRAMSPSSQPARLVRAVSVGVWVTFGSVVAHVLGAGAAPSLVALLPAVAGVSLATWWVSRRPIGLLMAVALLAVPQFTVHVLASYLHGHVMVPSASMLLAHVVSIAVTGGAIAHAERLWWSLWDAWQARWLPMTVVVPAAPVAMPVLAGLATPTPPDHLRYVVHRRGPPHS